MNKIGFLDAVKIGAAIRPQGKNRIFSDGKSCLYGAAIEGAGIMKYDETIDTVSAYYLLKTIWPFLAYHWSEGFEKSDRGEPRVAVAIYLSQFEPSLASPPSAECKAEVAGVK